MSASTRNLWAPLITPKRGKPWINHCHVRASRRAAKRAFLEGWEPYYQRRALRNVRFVRVTVTEQAGKV